MRLALVILALIAAAIGAALAFASARWNGVTDERVRQLQRVSGAPAFTADLSHELEGLPLPVQRYLRTVLASIRRSFARQDPTSRRLSRQAKA